MNDVTDEQTAGDLLALRRCLGQFATGVTVVTCSAADGTPCGITANSFSSVSLQPPLVLWNIAKVSNSLQAYLSARKFAINILSDRQRELSEHFARQDHTRFEGVDFVRSPDDVPILKDTLACLHCKTYEIHDCGDHYIIVGEVSSFRAGDGKPLLFFRGDYGELT